MSDLYYRNRGAKPGDEAEVRIEFPCEYPIKILGNNSAGFVAAVVAMCKRHAPELDESAVGIKHSAEGRFISVTVTITATGEPQLKALYEDLKLNGDVKMVI